MYGVLKTDVIFPLEPMMHAGKTYVPGEKVECDKDSCAAILHAGRGTLSAEIGKQAADLYQAMQKPVAVSANK